MIDVSVEVVDDQAAFLGLREEWDALVARARIDHPFLSHDWVRSWWESFGADKELHVLAIRSGSRLIAIAPLMRTRARIYGLPVTRLEFIANVHTPRFDVIVAEQADEAYLAILNYLKIKDTRWDIVMLPELAEHSRTDRILRSLAGACSMRTAVWVAGASPRIVLGGSFESFCEGLSGKMRSTLRKKQRQLGKLGEVALDVVSSDAEVPAALEDGLRIEASSWKGKAGTAIALHADLKRFYALLAERAARSGALKLVFLKAAGQRIAFAYCLQQGRTLYLLKTGYDPAYASHSPFNTLMYLMIEAAFRDGLEVIDLLGSEERWKSAWTQKRIGRRWFFLHRNSPKALLIYYLKFVILPRLRRKQDQRALPPLEHDSAKVTPPKLVRAQP